MLTPCMCLFVAKRRIDLAQSATALTARIEIQRGNARGMFVVSAHKGVGEPANYPTLILGLLGSKSLLDNHVAKSPRPIASIEGRQRPVRALSIGLAACRPFLLKRSVIAA